MQIKKFFALITSAVLVLVAGCDSSRQQDGNGIRISCGLPPIANIAARIAGENAIPKGYGTKRHGRIGGKIRSHCTNGSVEAERIFTFW